MWGVGWANGEMFFRVRKRQAAWAQYVMQRYGVPLLHRQFAEQPSVQSQDVKESTNHQVSHSASSLEKWFDWLDAILS